MNAGHPGLPLCLMSYHFKISFGFLFSRLNKRRFLRKFVKSMKSILALLLCFCLLACQGTQKRTDEVRVLALRGPSAIALAGWMESPPVVDGRTFIVRIADSPDQVVAAMVKGEADITLLPMINAANLHAKGVAYRLAGCPIWGNLFWVGRASARQIHVFGSGSTPDILTRYHLEQQQLPYTLNYSLGTASEVVRALLAGNAEAAVLPEPFVSMVMQRDTSLHLLADLNRQDTTSGGFAETAIMVNKNLKMEKDTLEGLLSASALFAQTQPERVIAVLQEQRVFAEGMLTTEAVGRCRIKYRTATESRQQIHSFLEIINRYEPRAIGGKLPGDDFYN